MIPNQAEMLYRTVVLAGRPVHSMVVSPVLDHEYDKAGLPGFGDFPLQSIHGGQEVKMMCFGQME